MVRAGSTTALIASAAETGISFKNTAGTVVNFGTVETTTTGTSGNAIYLGAGGVVTNYGMISGAGSAFLSGTVTARPAVVDAHGLAVTIRNFGTIASPPNGSNGVNLLAGGTVDNGASGSAGATITGSETGIYMGGTLGVPTPGALGSVNNYGLIQGTGGDGIFLASGGTVTNAASGVITGAIGAVDIDNAAGTVTNFGTVDSATDVGVYLGAGGLVTNFGLIESQAVNHGGVVLNNTAGTVVNLGTIENTGSYNGVRFEAGGYLANGGSGAAGALVSGVNHGVLIGGTTATGAAAVVTNFATITGNIGIYVETGDTGANTVTNAGSIIGSGGTAIQFGSGNDLLVDDPGAVFSGIVEGGAGGNTLELAAGSMTGTLSGLGASFVNFGTVRVDPGAAWQVSDAASAAPAFTNDGTILVTGGNTLELGAVGEDAGDSGLIGVGGSGVAEFQSTVAAGQTVSFLDATGTVKLDDPAQFDGTIAGFMPGDAIDLVNTAATSLVYSNGILTVLNNGATVAALAISGSYTPGQFVLTNNQITVTPPPPVDIFDFVFVYNDNQDYYYGTVADNGTFGYSTGEQIPTNSGTYDIFNQEGTTTETAGTVSVTYYSHGGPGQASYTPALTAAGEPDGTGGLGSESNSLLGTDNLQHPFSASMEASFTTSGLYGFVFNYANGAAYYFGTVADDTAPNPSPPGVDGSYEIVNEGVTGEPSGMVTITGYRDGGNATTYPTVGGGSAGLGSEFRPFPGRRHPVQLQPDPGGHGSADDT